MYLYYILGWSLNRQYFKKLKAGEELDSLKENLKVSSLLLDFLQINTTSARIFDYSMFFFNAP